MRLRQLFSWGDFALLALALLGLLLLYRQFWFPAAPAAQVQVLYAGEVVAEHSLQKPQQFSVQGHIGETRLEIADGRIRFVSAPCRHKVCINTGWVSKAGDTAACLPNRISLNLSGEREVDAYAR